MSTDSQDTLLVTIEDAFEKTGGFGKFQIMSMIMNTLANMASAFFLLAFAFLEEEPIFECNFVGDEWTIGSTENRFEEEFCAKEVPCQVAWSAPESLYNLLYQLDFYCAPKWQLGLIGALFLVGIVIGSVSLTKLADHYGRKPIYFAGLLTNFMIVAIMMFTTSLVLSYVLIFCLGLGVTMRFYVGYTFNIEMAPKK